MNHSPTHGLHLRRIQLRPVKNGTECPHTAAMQYKHAPKKHPWVIRQSYDISAACMREDDQADTAPIAMHFRGEHAFPLLRCAVIGAAAVGVMAGAALFLRIRREWMIRRKYARRYAGKLKEQRYRMKLRHPTETKTPPAAQAKS